MNSAVKETFLPNQAKSIIDVDGQSYHYVSLVKACALLDVDLYKVPYTLRILAENLLRHALKSVEPASIKSLLEDLLTAHPSATTTPIAFYPARVLMQDFTGVPAIADFAALRDALRQAGGDPARVNPGLPVDLVVDHSLTVDHYGHNQAADHNIALEFKRNHERYQFLRWGQRNFANFRVIPPGQGIVHQINIEYLADVIKIDTLLAPGERWIYPDTVIGTDSHTTMINALSVLGWGVGGIEAQAVMLGQPVVMPLPKVVGVRLSGTLAEGVTATDVVLTLVHKLRQHGVVDKFVEFFGAGLKQLTLADRATIANMAPEYGATCGFFAIDHETLRYLRLSGRDEHSIALVEGYAKAQGLWGEGGENSAHEPNYAEVLEVNLATVVPVLAGPKRPQDIVRLSEVASSFHKEYGITPSSDLRETPHEPRLIRDGDVVLAAITSCTNTSNPWLMIAAGLLARNARQRGIQVKPWVKTSLAPGSQVVTAYLADAGLTADLDHLGFQLVGYGCASCIGNSGPLADNVRTELAAHDRVVCSVLSGNRNFEGRVHPQIKANYLASPPLVVAYAISGTVMIDFDTQPLTHDQTGRPVYLRELWPRSSEIRTAVDALALPALFRAKYRNIFGGAALWQQLHAPQQPLYDWPQSSTYIRRGPFCDNFTADASANTPAPLTATPNTLKDIEGARLLALLGDSVTTDHISPAGSIKANSPAGQYLTAHGVAPDMFNSYGARRGNHEVMVRGTFANIRLKNAMLPGIEGGYTRLTGAQGTASNSVTPITIYEAARIYAQHGTALIIAAGKQYGTGSSRDWAAKGTYLLGVRAVIAESFERIHRANLVGMAVLPLEFTRGDSWQSLALTGDEELSLRSLANLQPSGEVTLLIKRTNGDAVTVPLKVRIDTHTELECFVHGGIFAHALGQLIKETL